MVSAVLYVRNCCFTQTSCMFTLTVAAVSACVLLALPVFLFMCLSLCVRVVRLLSLSCPNRSTNAQPWANVPNRTGLVRGVIDIRATSSHIMMMDSPRWIRWHRANVCPRVSAELYKLSVRLFQHPICTDSAWFLITSCYKPLAFDRFEQDRLKPVEPWNELLFNSITVNYFVITRVWLAFVKPLRD